MKRVPASTAGRGVSRLSPYQNRPEVIHIGTCGPGHEQIFEAVESSPGVVAREQCDRISAECAQRVALLPSANAPALFSEPSIPSVSAASEAKDRPSAAMASERRNSVLRPPLPCPRSVTVVSPPDSRTTGRSKGRLRKTTSRAIAAWTLPTSRASPSIASDRMMPGIPRASARAGQPPTKAAPR